MGLLDFFTRKRESSFTETISNNTLLAWQGNVSAIEATSAMETCAGWWSRAFASAQIEPRGLATLITPAVMAGVGRALVRKGEAVFVIGSRDGALTLTPATSWSIEGSAEPESWRYRVTLSGPSTTRGCQGRSQNVPLRRKNRVPPA